MASPPIVQVSAAPTGPDDAVSPGATDRVERKNAVLKKLRPPPLKHEWALWHDRHSADTATSPADKAPAEKPSREAYEDNLRHLIDINNVQTFWEAFNNFPLDSLVFRDSVHLFKKTVKPVWEDKRNISGGSWTFRVSKANSAEVWKCVQMMAIGEVLQDVVQKGDDICGVSLSIRFGSHLVSIWNRDSSNQKSIDAIRDTILEQLPEEFRPAPNTLYYKKHSEHKGFNAGTKTETKAGA